MRDSWRRLLLLIGIFSVLAFHASHYYPFFSDEALAALRYSKRIAAGLGITRLDGDRALGYSDFFWSCLNAIPAMLHIEPIWSARFFNFLGVIAAVLSVSRSPEPPFEVSNLRLFSAGALLVTCAPVAIWAIGGFEHGFMLGLFGWANWYFIAGLEAPSRAEGERQLGRAGLLFFALILARVDALVLFFGAAVGALASGSSSLKTRSFFSRSFLPPLLALSAQFAFRAIYYRSVWPALGLSRFGSDGSRFLRGLAYIGHGYTSLLVLLGMATLGCLVAIGKTPRARRTIPLASLLCWSIYVAWSGGDTQPGFRQLIFALVPLAWIAGEGAAVFGGIFALFPEASIVVWGVVLAAHSARQIRNPENTRVKADTTFSDGFSLGRLLGVVWGDKKPLLAVEAASGLAYWSELPTLDMQHGAVLHIGAERGNNPHAPRERLAENGAQIARRAPDIIAFCGERGGHTPCLRAGAQFFELPHFQQNYAPVLVQAAGGNQAQGTFFVRYRGAPLGYERTPDSLMIPGYFFASGAGAVARQNAQRRLVASISPDRFGRVENVEIDAGNWLIVTDPPLASESIGVSCGKRSAKVVEHGVPILRVNGPTRLGLSLGLVGQAQTRFELVSVTLRRIADATPNLICEDDLAPSQVTLAELAQRKGIGSYWASPGALLLSEQGTQVTLSALEHPTHLEIALDGNDYYRIKYQQQNAVLGQSDILPQATQPGFVIHSLELPREVTDKGIDSLKIEVVSGDAAFAIGHLLLYRLFK